MIGEELTKESKSQKPEVAGALEAGEIRGGEGVHPEQQASAGQIWACVRLRGEAPRGRLGKEDAEYGPSDVEGF